MNRHHAGQRRRLMQGTVAAVAAAAAGWRSASSASAGDALALTPARPVVWRDVLGVNAQFQIFSREQTARQIAALKALGLQWVRLSIHWMLAEPEHERWQMAEHDRSLAQVAAAGLRSIVYAVGSPRFASSVPDGSPYEKFFDKFPPRDPRLFASRLAMLARRYPQVDVWQVWNEPNIPGFWAPGADPEAYARLLAPCVAALRDAAPGHPIALAGMAYFSGMASLEPSADPARQGRMLDALGRLGVLRQGLIAAYHPYTADAEGDEGGSRDFVAQAQALNRSLRQAGVPGIWATEWGWSSYAGPREEQPIVGEDGQADRTLRRLALMAALDYDRIFLFTLADLDDPRVSRRDARYGLLRSDGQPKPVYTALARFLEATGPGLQPAEAPLAAAALPAGVVSIGWRRADGRRLWMVWGAEPLTLRVPGLREATLIDPLDGRTRRLAGTAERPGLDVPVTRRLQLLVW